MSFWIRLGPLIPRYFYNIMQSIKEQQSYGLNTFQYRRICASATTVSMGQDDKNVVLVLQNLSKVRPMSSLLLR